MPKILLLSDNHGYVDEAILHHAEWADEVWHAGDWLNMELFNALEKIKKPLRGVWGNADGMELRQSFPEHNYFVIQNLKFMMTHIGGNPGRYNSRILPILKKAVPNVFICGHSHILRVERDKTFKNMLYLNPGACGLQGFHKVRTALRFEIAEGKIGKMEVIEFGKRG